MRGNVNYVVVLRSGLRLRASASPKARRYTGRVGSSDSWKRCGTQEGAGRKNELPSEGNRAIQRVGGGIDRGATEDLTWGYRTPQGQLYIKDQNEETRRGSKYDGIKKRTGKGSIDQIVRSETRTIILIVQAISEILGLSHTAPERHPRGTLSPQGPPDARGIFCF